MHGRELPWTEPAPVLVYRDHLLRLSEVWVRSQGEALRSFRAHYAGSKRTTDLDMPADRIFLINRRSRSGRIAEIVFKTTGYSPRLTRWAAAVAPALIHAHYGIDGALMLPLARRLGVPLVVTFHGYEATMRDGYAARSFYLHRKYVRRRARLAREGALFIAVSKCVRQHLLAQGFPPDRTVTHYIGVDVRQFTPDPAIRRENVVLFVGRFDALKGASFAIRAMADVGRSNLDAELVLIGDGPARGELELLARRENVRCRFLGFRPQAEVRGWMNRAKILCVPSQTIETGECEAFGLVFAEAQAMGVPVASFSSGGIPEAVAHGITGFLAPERDWRALAGHVVRLLADPVLWEEMSRAARERTSALFDLATQTQALEDLYRLALRQQAAMSPRDRHD